MPEHHTKNTLEVTAWCPRCQRMTQHRCDEGRQGPCIDPKHGDRSPTRDGNAGERPFRVYFIDKGKRGHRDMRTMEDALSLFSKQPTGTATVWRTDKKNAEQLR